MTLTPIETPGKSAVTDWLLALITSRLPAGQKCGDARAEIATANGALVYPYWVLYSIAGGVQPSGPPLGQAQGDVGFAYQLDSVGKNRRQAEEAADRARNWVVGRGPDGLFVVPMSNPDGLVIHDRIVDGTPGAPLQEGQPPNEVFTVSDPIRIDVSVR
jgi:hypothetical protein